MNELDAILEDCLRQIAVEGRGLEECLSQYPEQRGQLRPLLEAALRVQRAGSFGPSTVYKKRTRAQLMAYAEAHPRQTAKVFHAVWRLGLAAAVFALLLLVSTTAFAQAALPGDSLYDWKLKSEQVWRALSPNRLDVDLELADRRATELTKVGKGARDKGRAWEEYHEVLRVLEAEMTEENSPQIDRALAAHQKKLLQAGLRDKKLDDLVHGKGKKNK